MPSTRDLIRKLPDLDTLLSQMGAAASPEEEIEERSFVLVGGVKPPPIALAEGFPSEENARERYVAAGVRALRKVKEKGPEVALNPEEKFGLEAIVQIEGRPAILIQEGHFFPPPVKWQMLEPARPQIETNLLSVGRIELNGHPEYEWCGTGFLVSDKVIMTNRHVAKIFCDMGLRRKWSIQSGVTARIDYVEEMGTEASAEFALTKVIGVHDQFDLSLFQVERVSQSGAAPPKPLPVSAKPPGQMEGLLVYTVGYPAWDGRRNDPEAMRKIFANIFDVKRLQPGEITSYFEAEKVFIHDCSTLGGNSGSCVIDLQTNQVLGLHFGGKYQQGNYAVALWQLTGDPLIKKAKVNFV